MAEPSQIENAPLQIEKNVIGALNENQLFNSFPICGDRGSIDGSAEKLWTEFISKSYIYYP